jgi:hypothetical protein
MKILLMNIDLSLLFYFRLKKINTYFIYKDSSKILINTISRVRRFERRSPNAPLSKGKREGGHGPLDFENSPSPCYIYIYIYYIYIYIYIL